MPFSGCSKCGIWPHCSIFTNFAFGIWFATFASARGAPHPPPQSTAKMLYVIHVWRSWQSCCQSQRYILDGEKIPL